MTDTVVIERKILGCRSSLFIEKDKFEVAKIQYDKNQFNSFYEITYKDFIQSRERTYR